MDEEGIEPKDIELVVSQVNCSRAKAVGSSALLGRSQSLLWAAKMQEQRHCCKCVRAHWRLAYVRIRCQQERHCGGTVKDRSPTHILHVSA